MYIQSYSTAHQSVSRIECHEVNIAEGQLTNRFFNFYPPKVSTAVINFSSCALQSTLKA